MEESISYFKGLLVKISIKWCISVPEDCFILANSAYPDEMPPLPGSSLFAKVHVPWYPEWKGLMMKSNFYLGLMGTDPFQGVDIYVPRIIS